MRGSALLSAAIIVRDEADFLRACLSSIQDVCDEIVVVDTGSTDESRDVARSFGAVQGEFPWNGSFADARNAALDLATGQWILYIDADEQLVDLDPAVARAELERRVDAAGLRVKFRSRPNFNPSREYRLWRHCDEVRFEGLIHETIVDSMYRNADREGLCIDLAESFSICHYGYEGDQTHKHRRNLPMLEKRVVEFPNRCYLWSQLGRVRNGLGDPDGAMDAWMTGLELIRRRGIVEPADAALFWDVTNQRMAMNEDVSDLIGELRTVAPWYVAADWLEGRNLQRLGRHREAIECMQSLIAHGPDVEDSVCFDNRMFTDLAWSAIGMSYYELGEFGRALEAYRIAGGFQPENNEYRTKIIALQALTGQ